MKLIVFGSTGSVGQLILEQALEEGHEVTAFARNPDKITLSHDSLKVVKGDVLDQLAVAEAVKGHDVVLCALGMPLMNNDRLRSKGTKNIVHGMEAAGVKRLVCLSALGTGDSAKLLPFHYTYIIVPLFMRRLFADHTAQEGYVRESGLDWVIVRPGSFLKAPKDAPYRHGFTADDEPAALNISTDVVASFMLQQVADDTYLRKAPGLSY